jgi:hypothetical protein
MMRKPPSASSIVARADRAAESPRGARSGRCRPAPAERRLADVGRGDAEAARLRRSRTAPRRAPSRACRPPRRSSTPPTARAGLVGGAWASQVGSHSSRISASEGGWRKKCVSWTVRWSTSAPTPPPRGPVQQFLVVGGVVGMAGFAHAPPQPGHQERLALRRHGDAGPGLEQAHPAGTRRRPSGGWEAPLVDRLANGHRHALGPGPDASCPQPGSLKSATERRRSAASCARFPIDSAVWLAPMRGLGGDLLNDVHGGGDVGRRGGLLAGRLGDVLNQVGEVVRHLFDLAQRRPASSARRAPATTSAVVCSID